MRKKSTRLLSAALAACMMLSVLPVGAFAAEPGTEPENTINTQDNQGELLKGSERILDTTIGSQDCAVYSLYGNYGAKAIEINTKKNVILNITGPVTYDNTKQSAFIIVHNVGNLTINGNGNTVNLSQSCRMVDFQPEKKDAKLVVNGGSYVGGCGFYIYKGKAELNNVTVHAVYYEHAVWAQSESYIKITDGDYAASMGDAIHVSNEAKVDLYGNVNATSKEGYAVFNGNQGEVKINNGHYTSKRNAAVYNEGSGTVEIYDGQFEGDTEKSSYVRYGTALINNSKIATAKIHGGHFVQKSGSHADYKASLLNVGTMIIDGSSVKVESEDCAAVENTSAGVLEIENGTFKSSGSNCIIVGNGSSATLTGGTIEAPNSAAVSTDGILTIDGATLQKSKYGVYVTSDDYSATGETKINRVTLSNNETDIHIGVDSIYAGPTDPYKEKDQLVTIGEGFTGSATVECSNPSDGRKITTATESNYQKELDLISANPEYTVAYCKGDDGKEYRYLKQRNSFTVTAIHATAEAVLSGDNPEKLEPTTQVTPGTVVSLKADENKKFISWTVKLNGVEKDDLKNFLTTPDENDPTKVTFIMPKADVEVTANVEDDSNQEEPVDPVGPSDTDNIKGALSAVVVGAAAGVIIYEAGTGIYRVINMPGIPMPSNRIELAELLWERADKPEPVSTALYDDIDEDDTDAQKAAHWAVEQDLMQDDEDDNEFHPHFPVSKLRTCLTWNAAKEKGLFDKTEE